MQHATQSPAEATAETQIVFQCSEPPVSSVVAPLNKQILFLAFVISAPFTLALST